MNSLLQYLRMAVCCVCTLGGLFVYITGVFGTFRFRHALNRVHAAALLDTLGILLMAAGLLAAQGLTIATGKMLVALVFLWITSPICSHLVTRLEVTVNDDLENELDVAAPDMVRREKDGE